MLTAAIVVVVLGVLLWFFLAPAGPTWQRHKPLELVRDWTPRLAMMRKGSSLTVQHEATRRSFSFLKAEDHGENEQTISFLLAEREWSPEAFENVRGELEQAPFVGSCSIQGHAPNRVLACPLTAKPMSMTFFADQLFAVIAPVLGLCDEDRFTLRIEGAMNYAIWRRVNVGPLRSMTGEDQHPIIRRLARWQVRKHHDEQRH